MISSFCNILHSSSSAQLSKLFFFVGSFKHKETSILFLLLDVHRRLFLPFFSEYIQCPTNLRIKRFFKINVVFCFLLNTLKKKLRILTIPDVTKQTNQISELDFFFCVYISTNEYLGYRCRLRRLGHPVYLEMNTPKFLIKDGLH